MITENTHEN